MSVRLPRSEGFGAWARPSERFWPSSSLLSAAGVARVGMALVFALLLGSRPAAAAQPYEGIWASEPEECKVEPASGEVAPMRLTAKTIDTYVWACDFKGPVRRKGAGWEVRAICSNEGEGDRERTTIRFWIAEGKLHLKTHPDDERVYLRCP